MARSRRGCVSVEALALADRDVWFVGRLATYRYYNMDQIVGQALAIFRRIDAALERPAAGTRRPAALAYEAVPSAG